MVFFGIIFFLTVYESHTDFIDSTDSIYDLSRSSGLVLSLAIHTMPWVIVSELKLIRKPSIFRLCLR